MGWVTTSISGGGGEFITFTVMISELTVLHELPETNTWYWVVVWMLFTVRVSELAPEMSSHRPALSTCHCRSKPLGLLILNVAVLFPEHKISSLETTPATHGLVRQRFGLVSLNFMSAYLSSLELFATGKIGFATVPDQLESTLSPVAPGMYP